MGSECDSAERENDAAFSEMKEQAIWKVTKQKLGMVRSDQKDPNSRSFRWVKSKSMQYWVCAMRWERDAKLI